MENLNLIDMRIAIIIFLGLFSFQISAQTDTAQWKSSIKALMESTISRADTSSPIPAINLLIVGPKPGIWFEQHLSHTTGGSFKQMNSRPIIQLASITKMFTAVVVLKLMEQGHLAIDDTLGKYFPDSVVQNLSFLAHTPIGHKITIKDLLRHTSGLKDYIFDHPTFLDNNLGDLEKRWSPEELLKVYLESDLPQQPHAPPGQSFYYSDTNYLLLGMLIEHITHQKLGSVYKNLIFEPLHLNQAYLDNFETPINSISQPLECWFGDRSITNFNISFDWGGGGLVMPLHELSRFAQALFSNKLFRQQAYPSHLSIRRRYKRGWR